MTLCALHVQSDADALSDALRDDLSAARWELRMLTEIYRACFATLCDAATEIERQRRMIAELREERERYAREIFGE